MAADTRVTSQNKGLVGTRQLVPHTPTTIDWHRLRDACAHAWPELRWKVGCTADGLYGHHGEAHAVSVRLEDGKLNVHVHVPLPLRFDPDWKVFAYIDADPDDGKRFANVVKQARRIWMAL